MRRCRVTTLLLLGTALCACGGGSSSRDAAATASPAAPTASVAAVPRPVSFTAVDGVRLSGRVYGSGRTAVVLSNMGDNDPALWDAFAPKLAERGYAVMTYSYRYPLNVASFDSGMARHTVDDLRGAVAQMRAAGATRIVLAGGSLGGMATAKVAATAKAAAMVVLSAPVDLTEYGFHVLPAELRSSIPKLFIGSVDDTVVPFTSTQHLFALAADPKQLKSYPGSEHALHLFEGEQAKDLADRLLAFITQKVPATA